MEKTEGPRRILRQSSMIKRKMSQTGKFRNNKQSSQSHNQFTALKMNQRKKVGIWKVPFLKKLHQNHGRSYCSTFRDITYKFWFII